ncbi:MAG: TonB-dependent receptor [Campylobacterota bacterium]|nr:TonB-dependent receptor [Campylobacterota bacterium]
MTKRVKISFITVALLSALHVEAQTVELKPLTITSTAIASDELRATDAVEIYTSEDIDKAHVQNIYEFLNQQTSVNAMPSFGNPFTQKLDLHGYGMGDGYQNVVVTLNGRKLNNIDMVAPLLSAISPDAIEKIEIIKSSGIVKAGDGANAGVINITTKQNNDREITLYGGTYGAMDGSFYLGHSEKKLSISASGEAQKNDGIREIDSSGAKDKNRLITGNVELAYRPIEDLELKVGVQSARTDVIYGSYLTEAEYDDKPTQAGATNWGASHMLYDTDAYSAGVSYDVSDNLSLHVDGSQENKKSNYMTYSNVSYYDYKNGSAHIDYDSDFVSVVLGYDYFDGNRKSSSSSVSKNSQAGYLMSEFELHSHTFKAGYRFDEISYTSNSNENQSDGLSGVELGYNYMFDKEMSIFADYAHSYQAADLDRLYNFTTGAFMGYVNPMQANSYTLGFNYFLTNSKFKLSAYYIDLKDEIYYYPGVNFVGAKNTNIDKSHKYGFDFYNKTALSDEFNFVINYNYVQAVIDKEQEGANNYDGNNLPGVSTHNIKATVSYLPIKTTTIALTQTYRSEAYAANDFNNNFTQKQDAYMSTDISVAYAKDSYEIFAKINNLFNQKNGVWIEDNVIYPTNFTTTAIAGLKLKF